MLASQFPLHTILISVFRVPHSPLKPLGFHSPESKMSQGRNQDLNLAKQKYEILTGHKNRCLKLYKMTVYQAKTL